MTIDRYEPKEIITKLVNRAFISIKLPNSNNPEEQQLLADLYIANAMASLGSTKKNVVTDQLKRMYKAALAKQAPNDLELLDNIHPFMLHAKVGNPRRAFHKEAFIKAVADKYDISVMELNKLAESSVKYSVAPITFTVSIDGDVQE